VGHRLAAREDWPRTSRPAKNSSITQGIISAYYVLRTFSVGDRSGNGHDAAAVYDDDYIFGGFDLDDQGASDYDQVDGAIDADNYSDDGDNYSDDGDNHSATIRFDDLADMYE
jgi:hypothetical protein